MNKKGFTLVELLGVIIVLGIIAMITIPRVNDSLKEARKNAFEDSVKAILVAVQNYQAEHYTDSAYDLKKGINLNDLANEIDIKNVGDLLSKEYNGTGSTTGGFIVSDNGTPEAVGIGSKDFCANGKKNSLVITDGPCEPTVDNVLLSNPANWESGEYSYNTGVKSNSASRIRFKHLLKVSPVGLYDYVKPVGKDAGGCDIVLRPFANENISSFVATSNHAVAKKNGRIDFRASSNSGYDIGYYGFIIYSVDVNNGKVCAANWTDYQKLLNSDKFSVSLTFYSE